MISLHSILYCVYYAQNKHRRLQIAISHLSNNYSYMLSSGTYQCPSPSSYKQVFRPNLQIENRTTGQHVTRRLSKKELTNTRLEHYLGANLNFLKRLRICNGWQQSTWITSHRTDAWELGEGMGKPMWELGEGRGKHLCDTKQDAAVAAAADAGAGAQLDGEESGALSGLLDLERLKNQIRR